MTNRRPSRCLGVIDEKKILAQMPGGREWLDEVVSQLTNEDVLGSSATVIDKLTSDAVSANIVSQLREEHATALAAILLQDWFRRRLCPDGV